MEDVMRYARGCDLLQTPSPEKPASTRQEKDGPTCDAQRITFCQHPTALGQKNATNVNSRQQLEFRHLELRRFCRRVVRPRRSVSGLRDRSPWLRQQATLFRRKRNRLSAVEFHQLFFQTAIFFIQPFDLPLADRSQSVNQRATVVAISAMMRSSGSLKHIQIGGLSVSPGSDRSCGNLNRWSAIE